MHSAAQPPRLQATAMAPLPLQPMAETTMPAAPAALPPVNTHLGIRDSREEFYGHSTGADLSSYRAPGARLHPRIVPPSAYFGNTASLHAIKHEGARLTVVHNGGNGLAPSINIPVPQPSQHQHHHAHAAAMPSAIKPEPGNYSDTGATFHNSEGIKDETAQQHNNNTSAAINSEPYASLPSATNGAAPAVHAAPHGPILGSHYIEQQHPKKSQWIAGFDPGTDTLKMLAVTLTNSDVSTARMRPPRPWYRLVTTFFIL